MPPCATPNASEERGNAPKPINPTERFPGSGQALIQSLDEHVARQVPADEDHLALLLLAGHPLGSQVAAHELVHALEDDAAVMALHEQHTLVAQHLGAVDLHDGAEEVLQLGGVEGPRAAEHEALDVVVVMVVVRVAAVLVVVVVVPAIRPMLMVMVVVIIMAVVVTTVTVIMIILV